jgi:hypothetical protein
MLMSQNSDIIDVEFDEVPSEDRLKAELNHPNFKKWFKGLLKETTVNVTFFKVNGDKREMRCTLNETQIPEDKQPKGTGSKNSPKDSIAVFDLDKQEWRSFRYDSLKEFDWEMGDDSEYPTAPEPVFFDEETEDGK